jgi:cobalt-precorrin 5A hydrolase
MIAAGFGCRAGCSVERVLAALEQSLQAAGRSLSEVAALCSADFKAEEEGLGQAAQRLQKPLRLFTLEVLREHSERALTRSARVLERLGLPSLAETAALAGAASLVPGATEVRLLGPRHTTGDVSCALAIAAGRAEPALPLDLAPEPMS